MSGDEAGPETARARAVLVEMQMRIEESAQAALGVSTHATAADIRRAFLKLAKTYHPTKFGRLPVEIQKQATEVFLALRNAHDALAKAKASTRTTGSNLPAVRPTAQQPPMSRPPTAQGHQPAVAAPRTKTDQLPVARPPAPVQAQPTAQPPRRTPTASPAPKHRTPAGGVPIPRPSPAPSASGSGAMKAMDPSLSPIYELMQRGQWEQARTAITALGGRDPGPKYQALLSYSRGREAQLDHRLDEARVELHEALQHDPDLQIAKTALAELFTRRK